MIDIILKLKIEEWAGIIALIISVISISYSYKGIKHSKYVETITNQRIKWIDVLRHDFSKILTLAILMRTYNYQVNSVEFYKDTDEFNMLDQFEKSEAYDEFEKITSNKKLLIKETSKIETINTIELAILKLNEVDDKELIQKLEKLKEAFLSKEYKIISDEFVKNLRISIKKLLKKEWEKVKKEVRKGGIIR